MRGRRVYTYTHTRMRARAPSTLSERAPRRYRSIETPLLRNVPRVFVEKAGEFNLYHARLLFLSSPFSLSPSLFLCRQGYHTTRPEKSILSVSFCPQRVIGRKTDAVQFDFGGDDGEECGCAYRFIVLPLISGRSPRLRLARLSYRLVTEGHVTVWEDVASVLSSISFQAPCFTHIYVHVEERNIRNYIINYNVHVYYKYNKI